MAQDSQLTCKTRFQPLSMMAGSVGKATGKASADKDTAGEYSLWAQQRTTVDQSIASFDQRDTVTAGPSLQYTDDIEALRR